MTDDVTIVEWDETYGQDFIALSMEWLEKHDLLEPADLEYLHHPHEKILNGGGNIFFARCDGRTVGTAAMVNEGGGTYELAKLSVTGAYQGRGISGRLMERCLAFAREQGATRVILFTNRKLAPAMGLYKKHGFVETPFEDSHYVESDTRMELDLHP